ncbi:Galactose oxidase [Ananas comosus]|uniref:Aldehyde oxidase GLOX n=1 Tax=Ananas comosus TaxID=4615 RepID=A0A199V0F3_ANACO|nr:Galactose oxidase [Ananas comosus]
MELLSSAHVRVLLFFSLLIFTAAAGAAAAAGGGGGSGGRWDLLQSSIGVSAMHMQLLHNDRVVVFDSTTLGPSNLSLPGGACRRYPNEPALKVDCTAHSAEYDVTTNSFRPLTVLTDTLCSSGSVAPDGTLVQTGGSNDGDRNARTFRPCSNSATCGWSEASNVLAVSRWYATNQILPDGRAIVIGGRGQFNYEFYPKTNAADTATIPLPFLSQTSDPEENNLYPFVHLNIDGNLFIFANNRAILLDYKKNAVVRTYPKMPGGDPRNYPSTGSSVLLPLKPSPTEAEVLVCGGAPAGSYLQVSQHGTFVRALETCGRIKITDEAPTWAMEIMPMPRVMGDMVLLPTGDEVLIINGAGMGAAAWEMGQNPVLMPLLYRPRALSGSRFVVQSQGTIPRLYHSTAVLLRDGRVLVGGSNPHNRYVFSNVEYPTELSLEAFSPEYLNPAFAASRPSIISPLLLISYGKQFPLRFRIGSLANTVSVTMASPAFATHSLSMNQRLLILGTTEPVAVGRTAGVYEVVATAPVTATLAPPGYYMVFVVNNGIPSEGIWIQIQ